METRRRRRRDREEPSEPPALTAPEHFPDLARDVEATAIGPARDDIARLAYELYEQRGCSDGHDWEDWFRAERALKQRHTPQDSGEAVMDTGAAVAV